MVNERMNLTFGQSDEDQELYALLKSKGPEATRLMKQAALRALKGEDGVTAASEAVRNDRIQYALRTIIGSTIEGYKHYDEPLVSGEKRFIDIALERHDLQRCIDWMKNTLRTKYADVYQDVIDAAKKKYKILGLYL